MALEPEFWRALEDEAHRRGVSLSTVIGNIDAGRKERNLASALRVHVLMRALGGEASPP